MADGELFAAMHDVGLAEFVAKGLDKKHRRPLPPLDVSGMTAAKAKVRDEFGGKKIFETCLGIYGNLRTTSTTFSSCAGRLASLGESRHTAFFLDVCERGVI